MDKERQKAALAKSKAAQKAAAGAARAAEKAQNRLEKELEGMNAATKALVEASSSEGLQDVGDVSHPLTWGMM